ncbi:LOW QUALITY PROTEIN: hypothetical protein YC2023_071949 [Brassica napus]
MNWSRSWSKVCDSDRIVPSPSRSASGPWCWVGRHVVVCLLAGRLTFHLQPLVWVVRRSCSCLIVGRWVDLCLGRFGGVITPLPFVHTARRSYRLNDPLKCSDRGDVGGLPFATS